MTFLLLIISIILTLTLVLLAMPITVAFRIDRIKEIEGQVSLQWLFGLVRFRIGIPGSTKAEPQRRPMLAKKTRKGMQGNNAHGVFTLLKQSAFRRRAVQFMKDVLRATHSSDLYLRLRIGLGDPADTGRLWILLGPIASIATKLRSAEVRIEPEFVDPMFEVESHGEFRFIPLQFISLATAFIVSPKTLRALLMLRQSAV